jgi:hypothetical protein
MVLEGYTENQAPTESNLPQAIVQPFYGEILVDAFAIADEGFDRWNPCFSPQS